jgi:hypothetical protein
VKVRLLVKLTPTSPPCDLVTVQPRHLHVLSWGKECPTRPSSGARASCNKQQHSCHNKFNRSMASKADEGPKAPRERISAKSTADPILRNALRYTISAKEYETLHKYIISRSKVLKRNAPSPAKVEKLVERPGRDDYNAAAVRDSLRVFLATAAGLKAWAVIRDNLLGGEKIRYVLIPKAQLRGC